MQPSNNVLSIVKDQRETTERQGSIRNNNKEAKRLSSSEKEKSLVCQFITFFSLLWKRNRPLGFFNSPLSHFILEPGLGQGHVTGSFWPIKSHHMTSSTLATCSHGYLEVWGSLNYRRNSDSELKDGTKQLKDFREERGRGWMQRVQRSTVRSRGAEGRDAPTLMTALSETGGLLQTRWVERDRSITDWIVTRRLGSINTWGVCVRLWAAGRDPFKRIWWSVLI